MKRRLLAAAGTLIVATAVGGFAVSRLSGCRGADLKTKIATRQLYASSPNDDFKPIEDWPRWRGPRGDGISRESAGTSWPVGGLKRLWVADVGIGYSSPVAAGGKLFLFTLNNGKDNLTCFDAQSGQVIWSDDSSTGWAEAGNYEGTRATPAVVGDSVYTFGGRGELTCRNVADGKPRWRQDVLALTGNSVTSWGLASSPLVEDGKVFVQAGKGGSVAVALGAKSGELAWKSEATGASGYASPILIDVQGTPQLIIFSAENVYGMDPKTGKTIWTQAWTTSYGVNAATPVYRDGYLYVSSAYGMGAMMLKLSPTSASKEWSKGDIKSKFQPPILDGNLLYGNTDQGGVLVCVSWPDGKRLWKADDSALTLGSGGSFVKAAGDKMVLLSENGMLSLTKVSNKGVELVGQFKATGSEFKVWSYPLLYGGRVYVKGPRELLCFELPK